MIDPCGAECLLPAPGLSCVRCLYVHTHTHTHTQVAIVEKKLEFGTIAIGLKQEKVRRGSQRSFIVCPPDVPPPSDPNRVLTRVSVCLHPRRPSG
jgi:hypothetical protein